MQNVSLKSLQEDAADDISRQHFQMQFFLAFEAPRKTASENVACLCHLLNILADFSTYFCIQANSVDPDQTGSTLFAKMTFKITSR